MFYILTRYGLNESIQVVKLHYKSWHPLSGCNNSIYFYLHLLNAGMNKTIYVSKEYYAHFSTSFQSRIDGYKIIHFRYFP